LTTSRSGSHCFLFIPITSTYGYSFHRRPLHQNQTGLGTLLWAAYGIIRVSHSDRLLRRLVSLFSSTFFLLLSTAFPCSTETCPQRSGRSSWLPSIFPPALLVGGLFICDPVFFHSTGAGMGGRPHFTVYKAAFGISKNVGPEFFLDTDTNYLTWFILSCFYFS
jgi:hypothetical protein